MQGYVLSWLGRVTWETALLAGAVLIIQWALGPRLSGKWRYGLWLLVLLRFAMPCSIESSWSIFNFARPVAQRAWAMLPDPRMAPRVLASAPKSVSPQLPAVQSTSTTLDPAIAQPTHARTKPWTAFVPVFAFAGWMCGCLAFIAILLINAARFARKVSRATEIQEPVLQQLLNSCRAELGVTTRVILMSTDCIATPAIYGWRKPRLLLPARMSEPLSHRELRFVFLHELAHIKRHDIPMHWLIAMLQAVHWFNPVAWFVFRRMRSDCELACDALVLTQTGQGSRHSYGETIVRLIERMSGRAIAPGLVGISHSRSNLRERMERIARFTSRDPERVWPVLLGFVLASVVLTDAVSRNAQSQQKAKPRVQLEEDAPNHANVHWSRLAPASMLKGRAGNTAVWTGHELIVFGGEGMGTSFTDGARYDLARDKWSALPEDGAPSSRTSGSAVWTGKEMIVWGGFGGISGNDTNRNDGAIYNPATDSWRRMSTEEAPSARFNHTAVWTGKEMLVWGGYTDSHAWYHGGYNDAHLNTGGAYSPSSDSWHEISHKGAPSRRFNHVAVWTGTRMIIWGGGNSTESLNDGGIYDPGTDNWTPTSKRNAPKPRSLPVTVWTGKYLLVWGGCTRDGKSLEDGGRYDPEEDTWTPISTDGAPAGRIFTQGIWTGKQMLFWGGVNDDQAQGVGDPARYVSSGGAYDPASDTWSTFATGDEEGPSARLASAVWTGDGLLIFGGYNGTHLNDAYLGKFANSQ